MDRTDVAALHPLPAPVYSPSIYSSTSTGVTPIDQPPCRARKRSRISSSPSSANLDLSPSSFASRVTKPKSSPSSSLVKSPPRKRRGAAAGIPAVASNAAVDGTPGGLRAFEHEPSDTNWDNPIPSDSPCRGGELTVSDATRDHFSLSSSTLAQDHGPDAYNWSYNHQGHFTLGNDPPPASLQPHYYPAAHENLLYENSPGGYPVGYSSVPSNNYSAYAPLPSVPSNPQAMIMEHQPPLSNDVHARGEGSPEFDPLYSAENERVNMNDLQYGGWCLVGVERLAEGNNKSDTGEGVQQASDQPVDDSAESLEGGLWENIAFHAVDDTATDENDPVFQPERHFRSRLSEEHRRETGHTRKLKKIRCRADPEGGDCLTCQKINLGSKKVIHKLPCLRWKLAEVVLFREGGLNLTKRWTGIKMRDLAPRDWDKDDRVRTITVIIGSHQAPLELKVKKFIPNKTDVTWKHWVDSEGEIHVIQILPYALANIWQTAEQYKSYVYVYSRVALLEYVNNPKVDSLVRKTYHAALKYAMKCHENTAQRKWEGVDPSKFLEQYFCLWFAIRNTLGSAFIVGQDTLDMGPINDQRCPYHGKVSLPRMISAQFDSLGHEVVFTRYRKLVLEGLWRIMGSKSPTYFYLVYLVVFMLLHEVSFTSTDRFRRAKENKYKGRYDLPLFTERLQEGANIILSHWHYYKRDINTLMADMESEDKRAVWGELNPDEIQLLVETRDAYRKRDPQLEPMSWEHDLYFVSQMFEEGWSPKDTFK